MLNLIYNLYFSFRGFFPSSQDGRNGNPLHEALVLLFFFFLLSFSFVSVSICNKKKLDTFKDYNDSISYIFLHKIYHTFIT